MKAGFCQLPITPAVGSEMPGMLSKRYGQSVHDDLFATAMLVDDGATEIVFVGVDALSVKRSIVHKARRRIETETGIPGARRVTVPRAGHQPHQENSEAWQRAIASHLDRVRDGSLGEGPASRVP